jgi:hypothetical protein
MHFKRRNISQTLMMTTRINVRGSTTRMISARIGNTHNLANAATAIKRSPYDEGY